MRLFSHECALPLLLKWLDLLAPALGEIMRRGKQRARVL